MIEGIEILNKTVIMDYGRWFLPAVLIGSVLLWFGIAHTFEFILDCDVIGYVLGGVVTFLFILFMAFCIGKSVPTDRYRYETTIDKSVNFTELYEKYDIVEKRGEIYILEDKETTKNE